MSAMKDLATPALTLDHDEHQALIAVVKYILEDPRIDRITNPIWYQARILLHTINA